MEVEDCKYEKVNTTSNDQEQEISPVSYFQLYQYSTILDKFLLLVAVIFCIVSGVFEVLFSLVFGRCVGAIANFGTDLLGAENETRKLEVEEIFMKQANEFAASAGAIAFIVFFSFYVSTTLFNYTAMRQIFKIRELYFYQVIMQDIPWHDQSPTGDFASRITDDLRKIQEGINDKASMSIYHITVITAGVVQSLIMGWQLTLVCLASFPVSFVTMACIGKISTKLAKDESEVYGEAGKVADETLTYIKTVVAFEGQREEIKRYDSFLGIARKNNIRRYFFLGLTNSVTVFFMNVGVALAIWYGVTLIMKGKEGDGDYNIAKLVTIYNSIIMSTSNVGAITPFLETFNSAKGAAAKIFSTIEDQPVITKSYETGTKIDTMIGTIEFQEVDFSYPARKQVQVLSNINLKVKAGETVALVGCSGCGKSTILQLVQRFYDANRGRIYIDGIDIRNLNLTSLRNQIGLVGQEPVLFDGTIAENIRLGNMSATQFDVEEAAKKSNAHSFILSFPNGYQTMIGERGAQLSGGQKQRIAIARALVRKPAVLLLDEATSALDSNSVAVVQATLDEVSKDCTTLIVSHRLATVRNADRIIVLDNGTVMEEGSHDALMVAKGAYHNLVVTQLSSEEEESSHGSEFEPTVNLVKHNNFIKIQVEKDREKIIYNFTTVWKILTSNLSPKWCIIVGVISSMIFGFGIIYCMIVLGKSLAVMSGSDADYVVSQVNMYAFQFIMIGLVLGISSILQAYLIGIAGENLTLSLRSSMFKTMIHQEIGWFDRTENGVGSLGARLAGEPSNVQNAIGLCTGPFLNVITMTVLLFGVGFYMSWKLLLGFLGFLPFLVLMIYLEQKVLVQENLKNMEVLEQSTKLAVEAISNVRTIASLAIEKVFHARYMMKLKTHSRLMIRNIHIQGIVYGLSKGSLSLSYIITIFYGAYLMKNNETDAATVIGLTEVFATSIGNLTYTLVFLSNLTKGFVACNQIYDLLNRVSKINNSTKSTGEVSIEGDVEYKSVSFAYPTRPDINFLDDFNLIVSKGTTVALVGPSGCGKSTIVQLLIRFYDSNLGRVTLGEEDITKINMGVLRLRLGIVMQEPNLFSRTIADNIAYGNLGRRVSRAEIIGAAKMANIHNFISSLPLGYDTSLGEKGTQLSGGQKQRIAIARALVRNPDILLLDEATSALDAESEKVVQEALNNAREERTCIVIAHRLKTIADADVIAVMNEGRISEMGTHQELMGLKGLYWNLYNLQHQS